MIKKDGLKVTVYTPAPGMGSIGQLIKEIFLDLKQAHQLGLRLAKRNIKSLYRKSFLGYFWSVAPPFFTSLIWVFLNNQKVVNIEVPDVPYPLFVLIGTLLWQIFAESVNAPLKSTTSSISMLTKINFPREALLLGGVYEVIFNSLIKVGLILLILVFFQFYPPISGTLAIFGIISLIILGTSLGYLLTPLGLLYTDISRGIVVILQFAIYLTPVIYPEPRIGMASLIMKLNPVAPILTTTRGLLLDIPIVSIYSSVVVISISIVLLFLGLILFRLSMPILVERIGS